MSIRRLGLAGTVDMSHAQTEVDRSPRGVDGCCHQCSRSVLGILIPEEKETKGLAGELLSESELLLKPESGTVFIEIPYTIKGTENARRRSWARTT